MAQIDDILRYLGQPYTIKTIDFEPVIYRLLDGFEFEVSGLHKRKLDCTVYVWMTSPHRELMVIYSGIKDKDDLKDLLGYCSVKYRNLLSRIQVEREDQIK